MKTFDDIILQYSDRGMDKVKKEYPKYSVQKAGDKILLLKKGIVFLYTGFYVAGYAETDGPIGTYFLAKALKKLDFEPIVITDQYCKEFFKEIQTLYFPIGRNSPDIYMDVLDRYKPVAHISCERCGQNKEGKYLNHKLQDISKYTADIDELFKLGSKKAPTFAIGDGGNEIGMGNFKEHFEKLNSSFFCTIECDYPIVASVSNWGAYALIASFSKKLLPTFKEVDSYLEFIVQKGAVDGIKKVSTKSVDGKKWKIEKEILKQLHSLKSFNLHKLR